MPRTGSALRQQRENTAAAHAETKLGAASVQESGDLIAQF